MRVSAIKSYDYVHKNNNGPQRTCSAPMPYATQPNFGAPAAHTVTGLKGLGKKILGFVAAMGLFSGVAVQNAYGQQKVDSPFKIDISVKGNDGKEELKPIGIADDANYVFDLNGTGYSIILLSDTYGFAIYDDNDHRINAIPINKEQHKVISHLAAVDGNPNELSLKDVQLVNTNNLNLSSYRVTRIQYDGLRPNDTAVSIEKTENGKTVSYVDVYALKN